MISLQATRRRLVTATGIVALNIVLIGVAFGQPVNTNWTGATSSDWFTATNWSAGPPAATTIVYIPAISPAPTVNGLVSASPALGNQIIIGRDQTNSVLPTQPSAVLNIINGGSLTGGTLLGGPATFSIGAGTTAQSFIPGLVMVAGANPDTGAKSTLTTAQLTVGNSSPGTLDIVGGVVTANTGSITVNVGASAAGEGTVTISDGGRLDVTTTSATNPSIAIGSGTGATGTVLVTGADSILTANHVIRVGSFGTGALTIADSGEVSIAGGTGTLNIGFAPASVGTLNIGAAPGSDPAAPGTLTAATVSFANSNGTINFNHTATDYVFVPAISGPGRVNVFSGTTILNAVNTYTGGTTISAGTLQIGDGGPTGNIIGDVIDNGTLVFNRSGDKKTFAGVISGSGSLVKLGSDTLELTAFNTYSGGTTIDGGTLAVGVPEGSAQETSSALGTGNVFLNGGTLRTTSFQTGVPLVINVGGNYTQGSNGTLALGVAGLNGRDYDRVQVGGNASLDGTLAVSSLNNFRPSSGDAFGVLRTNGRRSGEFADTNDSLNNSPNLARVNVYAPNGVALVYVSGPNQPLVIVTPIPLPPIEPNAPLRLPLIAILAPTAEQLTALFEIPFSGANIQRFNLDDRMTQIQRSYVPPPPAPPPPPTGKEAVGKEEKAVAPPPPPAPAPRWGVWANGWGDWVHVNNTGLAKGYHFTTGGMSAGIDYRLTDHLAVGLFGGYSHTWVNFKPGDSDVDTGRGGLYATYFDPTGWWVNAGAWGGYNSYSTSRQALLGPANGSTNGYEVSTFGDAGYNINCGNLTFGPIVAMQYTTAHISGFTEHGSLVPLDVHADSEDSLRTDVGGQAYYTWHVGNISVIPGLRLAWEHEYKYSNLPLTVSAPALGGATANFSGPNLGHDSLIINANVGIQITPQIAATIGYDGQLARDHYISNAVTGTFSYSF